MSHLLTPICVAPIPQETSQLTELIVLFVNFGVAGVFGGRRATSTTLHDTSQSLLPMDLPSKRFASFSRVLNQDVILLHVVCMFCSNLTQNQKSSAILTQTTWSRCHLGQTGLSWFRTESEVILWHFMMGTSILWQEPSFRQPLFRSSDFCNSPHQINCNYTAD